MGRTFYSKFVPVEHEGNTSIGKCDGIKFRVVSYNILAQYLATSKNHPHSPLPCLREETRMPIILDVLMNLNADILCLQELDEYKSFYKNKVERNGYSSIYIRRSRNKEDGCGIFYKHNKMELVMEDRIEYNDLLLTRLYESGRIELIKKALYRENEGQEQYSMAHRLPYKWLKRDNVGIMAAFKFKDPSEHYVIVANSHLHWNPELAVVKLAQAKYFLLRVAQFKQMVAEKFQCTPSVVIAGDLNSVPGSQVYKYLVSGGQMTEPSAECSKDAPMPLCSVYAYTGGEPVFTNVTPAFTDTLDYIFFTPSKGIEPIGYLMLPEADSTSIQGGLPNYYHPSDHLPIGAEFMLV